MALQNLIGQKFGQLTVIQYDKEKTNNSGRTHWICECDCDNHTRLSVAASNLKSGNSTRCKYCRNENLIGKKFNMLTVIKRVIDDQDKVKWQCECECGNIIITRGDSLKSGHTKSCGCLQRKHISQLNFKDLTGQTFGKLTAVKRSERKNLSGQYYWFCDCECGTKNKEIDGHNLVSRGTISCGCIRSKGEEKIAQILTDNNITFQREYSTPDFCFDSGRPAFFDFAILDNNQKVKYFIEYQGEQHYQARGSIFTEEKVEQIQKRDELKKEYCETHNIPIIYICYTDFNNITINDLIINE